MLVCERYLKNMGTLQPGADGLPTGGGQLGVPGCRRVVDGCRRIGRAWWDPHVSRVPTGCRRVVRRVPVLGKPLTGADGMPTGADGSFVCRAITFSP